MLHIDIIEHCNFKCYFCQARNLKERTYMDLDLFKRIIDQASALGITTISLTPYQGEPFLHPHIYEMLAYSVERLPLVTLDTNASAIDVDRLALMDRKNLRIKVSKYGRDADEFVKMTNAPPRLHDVVVQKLIDLTEAGIKFTVRTRELDHAFNYDGSPHEFPMHDISIKCKAHMIPQIFSDGDVTFCRFIRDGFNATNWKENAPFANLNTTSLADALSNPIRYKFYDSQSMCAMFCKSSYCAADVNGTLTSYKLMAKSKQNYITNKESTDQRYATIELNCLQSNQPQA